jgi:PhoU domain
MFVSTDQMKPQPAGAVSRSPLAEPRSRRADLDADLPFRRSDALERLALRTADALESAVDAALAGDRAQARRVLRRAAARTSARRAADARVRQCLAQRPPRTGNLRGAASLLQLITDLRQIGQLINTLARHTANGDVPHPVPGHLRHDMLTVQRSGASRLRAIAEGLQGPAMDPGYVRTGDELRTVVDHLTQTTRQRPISGHPDRAPVQAVYAELATCVLNASTHAARAA